VQTTADVMLAQAGIHFDLEIPQKRKMDARFRGNDGSFNTEVFL
jgi:hypothetical protein